MTMAGETVVLDRREGPYGEVVLRQDGELLQIIANGCFLMDTSDGRSERVLVRSALAALDDRPRPWVLIGGLGVGFSLAEAADEPHWGRITVVEREEAIIDWHRSGPLTPFSARALADPRTEIVHAGLLEHLSPQDRDDPDDRDDREDPHPAEGRYDVLCLDIDNGPDWTVTDDNRRLYSPAGLAACRAALTPGGVLAVWSAQASTAFADALRDTGFVRVRTEEIPVVRGVPDIVQLATRPA